MSEFAANLNNSYTDASFFLSFLAPMLSGSGVLSANALTVSVQSPSPDMTLNVSGSNDALNMAAFITATGAAYVGKNTATKPVTIQANSSGVTKTDAIVAYIDLAAGVNDINNPNNPGALKFLAVRRSGTNTGVPTNGEIDAETSNNPWIKLATCSVTNNATAVSSVTDVRILAGVSLLANGLTITNPVINMQALGTNAGAPGSVKIAESILAASTASVTFSSIPQVYRSLRLVWMARGGAAAENGMPMIVNGDTGANYELQEFNSFGTTEINTYTGSMSYASIGDVTGATSAAGYFNMGTVIMPFYASTTAQKVFLCDYFRRHQSSSGNLYRNSRYAAWKSTAAITSLTISPASNSFMAGSSFVLYGEP